MRISWPAREGVRAYRLSFTDGSGAPVAQTEELLEPSWSIDDGLFDADPSTLTASLELRHTDSGAWEPHGPPARIPLGDDGSRPVALHWESATPISRLIVHDRTTAATLFDEPVLGSTFPFDCPPDSGANDLFMCTRPWVDGEWGAETPWKALPREIVLGERRQPPEPVSPSDPPALLLSFTIDTECSILRQHDPNPARVVDELVFGDFGSGTQHGIGLHMDLLEHFGHRGCFFLDVLMEHRFGREAVERIVEAISERGHEIQLHLHAEHLAHSEDPAAREVGEGLRRSHEEFFPRALELGVELFEARTGRPPVAYRAGGYRIKDEHFPLLEDFGISIDSSVQPYFNSEVSDWMKTRTQPFRVGKVLEVPPSWVLLREDGRPLEPRTFAPNPTTGDAVTSMRPADGNPPLVATYVSHSFQLLRNSRADDPETVAGFEERLATQVSAEEAQQMVELVRGNMRLHDGELDEDTVAACAGVLRRIADRPDARCVTYAELAALADDFWSEGEWPVVDPIPVLDRTEGVVSVVPSRTHTPELLARLSLSDQPAPGGDLLELLNEVPGLQGGKVALIGMTEGPELDWLEQGGTEVEKMPAPPAQPTALFDAVIWPRGFEHATPPDLGRRLDRAAALLRSGGSLLLGLGLLGEGISPAGSPPLSHLLFADCLPEATVAAWDASTFAAWFDSRGLVPVAERRRRRAPAELAVLERQHNHLRGLSKDELEVAGLELVLRRAQPPVATPPTADGSPETESLEQLDERAARLYSSLDPGHEMRLSLPAPSGPATVTTAIAALIRAGLVVLDASAEGTTTDLLLARPLGLGEFGS